VSRSTVSIRSRAADRLDAGHAWVYASDVANVNNAEPGSVVTVLDSKGRGVGTAHYSSSSQIALRLLSREIEEIDRDFLAHRLERALAHRRLVVSGTDACRLVFSEADQLPGLIVDRYGDMLVVQTLTQGMDAMKRQIAAILDELCQPAGIWERNDVAVREKESLPFITGPLLGDPRPSVEVRINDILFASNLASGQKTGVYLDQRENYLAAARYAHGEVLDCFTSTGGFALHAARKGLSVEAVDSGAAALEAAKENARLNKLTNIRFRQADAFDLLAGYRGMGRRFGTVILDPPAFAKTKSALTGAARGYADINRNALGLLGPGGILVTCSCSHHMSEAMLLETVAEAALDAGRTLRVLERRTQAADHPVLLTVPETLYLKCLILQVL